MEKATLEAHLAAMIAAGPGTVTAAYTDDDDVTTEVTCLKSRLEMQQLGTDAGFQNRYAFSLVSVLSDWGDDVSIHQTLIEKKITVTDDDGNSETYRVLRAVRCGTDVELRLDLGSEYPSTFEDLRGFE